VRLIHGRADRLIPFSESLRLREAFPPEADVQAYLTGLFAHSQRHRRRGPAEISEQLRFLRVMTHLLGCFDAWPGLTLDIRPCRKTGDSNGDWGMEPRLSRFGGFLLMASADGQSWTRRARATVRIPVSASSAAFSSSAFARGVPIPARAL
jgi:hypothetical protein